MSGQRASVCEPRISANRSGRFSNGTAAASKPRAASAAGKPRPTAAEAYTYCAVARVN